MQIRAVVTVTRADGSTERVVSGASCEDVADAVAFILALALDAEEGPSAAAPPVASGLTETAGRPPETAPIPASMAITPTTRPSSSPASSASPPARFAWGGGVLLGATGGVAPTLAFSEGLFFEAARRPATALTQSFRLVGLHAGQTAETPAGTAGLDLFALRLQACPLGFGRATFVELCASFDYGRLRGRGHDAVVVKTSSATWYGPGVLGRAGAAVGGPFEVGVEGGLVVPLARDRFYFRPDVTAHTIPSLVGYGLLFVGLHT